MNQTLKAVQTFFSNRVVAGAVVSPDPKNADRPYAYDFSWLVFTQKLALHGHDQLSVISEQRQSRVALHRNIAEFAEDGMVAVVQSGMDCDCSRYSGWVSLIPATVAAFDEHYESVANSADGPFNINVERPSVAQGIQRTSRDLALEAFEDGHQHVVYS